MIQTFRSRVIAVASGKGGVGKTNVVVNLGLALARRGLRVALLDADLGTANVDIVLGLHPRYHLHHVVTGQKSLAEIIVNGPFGLQVIPGASGLPDLADLPEVQRDLLLRALLVLEGNIDLLLIDTCAGVGRNVVQFILAASELLLVTNPEPTALTDAYALLKVLANYQWPVLTKLVVNNARNGPEGDITGRKLAAVTEQFLGRRVDMIGTVPHDQSVVEAVKRQSPLLQSYPRSPAAVAINRLGERLWAGSAEVDSITEVSQFFKRLLSLGTLSKTMKMAT
ncbi:MAG: MinD/ParA family protein [Anaerolineae bacterium]|nr:MinD/ParA family protein [Anaerolineae bacterium]